MDTSPFSGIAVQIGDMDPGKDCARLCASRATLDCLSSHEKRLFDESNRARVMQHSAQTHEFYIVVLNCLLCLKSRSVDCVDFALLDISIGLHPLTELFIRFFDVNEYGGFPITTVNR